MNRRSPSRFLVDRRLNMPTETSKILRRIAVVSLVILLFRDGDVAVGSSAWPIAAQSDRSDQTDNDAGTWWDRAPHGHSDYYWIKTDLPRHEARELARHLDRIHAAMHERLGSLPARQPQHLNVFVFQHYEDYLSTLRSRFDINAIGTGGMFFVRPEGGAIAIWTGHRPRRRVHAVLQHEAFHQFAYSRFGSDLPVWVNEGLAMFFGEAVLVGRTLVIGQSNPRMIKSVRDAIEHDRTVPFREMLTIDNRQWAQAIHAGAAQVQYHQAWSMVHFLIYGDEGRYVNAFERYLRLMNDGVSSEPAFIQAFETDRLDLFEARWRRYMLEDAVPSAFVTALERIEFLAEGMLELSRRGALSRREDADNRPKTIQALQKALLNIDFTMTISIHGVPTTLSAGDESLFTIPKDEHTREQPEFVLNDPRLRLRTRRQRELEKNNPTPPIIQTRHLQPHALRIEWRRDEESNSFSYEIIAR